MDQYEIEFKIEGLAVCKPDTLLTNEMKFSEANIEDHSFSVLIASEGESPDEAYDIAFQKLNLYLDYYELFFDTSLEIANDGEPVSIHRIKDGEVVAGSYGITLKVGPLFILTNEMKDHAINILNLLSQPRNSYLRIAVDYNRRSSLESKAENELIHLFTALEALYSTENEKQEITYRFANRIATLLGRDKEHRILLMKRAKKLYNLRSQIVHGSWNFKEGENIEDVFDWVRESILRFLVLSDIYSSENHDNLIDRIDNAMLDNDLRDKLRGESEVLVKDMEDIKAKAKEETEKIKEKNQ